MSSPANIDTTEEIFEDSLLSLFQHRPIAFSTRGADDPYVYVPSGIQLLRGASSTSTDIDEEDGKTQAKDEPVPRRAQPPLPIKIYLPTAPPELHTTLQLSHLWLSSVFLADLISHGLINVKGERICELGAGAGLPGIVSALRGAGQVVSTDYAVQEDQNGQSVLAVLRGNFLRAVPAAKAREGTAWTVLGHTWGDEASVLRVLSSPGPSGTPEQPFSLLLLADLLWSTASHAALVASLTHLLEPGKGRACVVAGLHQGRGPVERFIRSWREIGGWIKYEMEVQWGLDSGWEVLEDFRSVCSTATGKDDCGDWEYLYSADRDGGDEHGTVVFFTIGLGKPS
ncbi:hypothetical protein QFC21_000043 [Naganishia friedmannii]|uniref:Uncharacterized protein n=1 Tax=Naganishia friedmannii TaxID=89922 RepID=A0ACC2WBG1_9TREE|nr:hypothetical protein QFC21_000043 [Naganishia friedmannii]